MKSKIIMLISALLIVCNLQTLYAFQSVSAQQPADHMSTGSRYAPSAYEVDAQAPSASFQATYNNPAGAPAGRRNGPPSDDNDNYDPDNAQYGPMPDGTLFLLLLAAVATAGIAVRRRRMTETSQMTD